MEETAEAAEPPTRVEATPAQQLNPFSYALNSPANVNDPSGYQVCDVLAPGCTAAGALVFSAAGVSFSFYTPPHRPQITPARPPVPVVTSLSHPPIRLDGGAFTGALYGGARLPETPGTDYFILDAVNGHSPGFRSGAVAYPHIDSRKVAHYVPVLNTLAVLTDPHSTDFDLVVAIGTDTVVLATFGLGEGAEGANGVAEFFQDTRGTLGFVRAGFSPAEMGIVNEVRGIPLGELRAAFEAGGGELTFGGRTIVIAPDMAASGMTLFGENGFVLGRDAFASDTELTKTLLHETYRLTMSRSAAGVSGAMATEETNAAFSFAERGWEAFFR